jgi:5-methylcytosine-specific restriction protein A
MFPLRVIGLSGSLRMTEEAFRANEERKAQQAKRLSDEELRLRAEHAPSEPGRQHVEATRFTRDPHVAELAKRRAGGYCQLCGRSAPFNDKYGAPYLETHHIVWLSRGGRDSTENAVALCPNCHRRMHVLDSTDDIATLTTAVRPFSGAS